MDEQSQTPIWRLHINNLASNYDADSEAERLLLLAFLEAVSEMAAQEQQQEDAQILAQLDAQVQGDDHPQALEWIMNSYRKHKHD